MRRTVDGHEVLLEQAVRDDGTVVVSRFTVLVDGQRAGWVRSKSTNKWIGSDGGSPVKMGTAIQRLVRAFLQSERRTSRG